LVAARLPDTGNFWQAFYEDLDYSDLTVLDPFKSHIFFAHEQSGAETALPVYRSDQAVMPHHLATVRIMLDQKGLMDGNAFDDFVASASTAKSAS